jgi:hypothetical protein
MAQLVNGPRYEYLIEELRGAIRSSMFDLGGEAACERLQAVLDVLRFELVLGGLAQDAREDLEQLLAIGDEDEGSRTPALNPCSMLWVSSSKILMVLCPLPTSLVSVCTSRRGFSLRTGSIIISGTIPESGPRVSQHSWLLCS